MERRDEQLLDIWQKRMRAEAVAGIPKTPGTAGAVWAAALEHRSQVWSEMQAVKAHLGG